MSRVAVTEEVLRWALNRSEKSEDGLQKKIPKIHQWLTGESQPTLRQLETFAKATYTPLGFLFLEKPPQDRLPIPHFRTLGDEGLQRPSPNLLETIQIMQRRQSWMREFLIEQGQEGLPYVKSVRLEEHPRSTAKQIKKTLGLDEEWAARQPTWTEALSILRENLENAGILVVVNGVVGNNTHRKLDPNEFRGFVLVDEYAPLVFVNGADYKAAQMFTLAHEIAHVFLGSSAAFDLREMQPAEDPMEQRCNRVAAEFLVPENEIRKVWDSVKSDTEPFQTLARRFKVSVLVVARRALDLHLIDKEAFLQFYKVYTKRQKSVPQPEGGDFYANQNLRIGRRFASTVIRATKEGKLLYSEAYQLTGLYGNTFESYTSHIEMSGR
ncbi:MAG TPA: ImmA/IrrE family metallo-endopeptidase [bacterium]|nr:ImmA/IrrE family metallo-endopeptidase [bacterium]